MKLGPVFLLLVESRALVNGFIIFRGERIQFRSSPNFELNTCGSDEHVSWRRRADEVTTKSYNIGDDIVDKIAECATTRRAFFFATTTAATVGSAVSLADSGNANANAASDSDGDVIVERKNMSTNDNLIASELVYPYSRQRQYRHLTLSNGLRVILVSDKKALRQTASLSIQGAGQFLEPKDIGGLAHLMEHMSLSSSVSSANAKSEDNFEDWLSDRDGYSNAFTGASMVNFHFSTTLAYYQEALEKFANLFRQESIQNVCRNSAVIRREVRRVDSELDFSDDSMRSFYVLKHLMMDPDHPFARFTAGSYGTLEQTPREKAIDVGKALYEFYRHHYLPKRAVLVAVGSADLATLQRYVVTPFESILSKIEEEDGNQLKENEYFRLLELYPEPFLSRNRLTQVILLRSMTNTNLFNGNLPKLTVDWPLSISYDNVTSSSTISAESVGFIISQIFGRRGPSSLYRFLRRRGWNSNDSQGVPRISFPVDVNGFQILRLELCLTLEGFANRAGVVAALFSSINSIQQICPPKEPFLIPRELIRQYVTAAILNGYYLAPRPPDAVEMAVDAQVYGFNRVGVNGVWPIMPNVDDGPAIDYLRQVVASTLQVMNRPPKALVTLTATPRAIFQGRDLEKGLERLPPFTSIRWQEEPLSGARYLEEDAAGLDQLVKKILAANVDIFDFGAPKLNPLIPAVARPALMYRTTRNNENIIKDTIKSDLYYYMDDGRSGYSANEAFRTFLRQPPSSTTNYINKSDVLTMVSMDRNGKNNLRQEDWKLWQFAPDSTGLTILPLAKVPEASGRCWFIIQMLSERPTRAKVAQGAHAELWKTAFNNDIVDLAELGVPGALSYEMSFNRYGLRLCFVGLSQTLPSYTRRVCSRLVEYHQRLLDGTEKISSEVIDLAVIEAKRNLNGRRRRQAVGALVDSTAEDAGQEGKQFLASTERVVCLAQGDYLPDEATALLQDLQVIFRDHLFNNDKSRGILPQLPELSDLLYKPMLKPRSGLTCFIPGANLISDACGRVPR